jgi:hypothetical protein
MTPPARRPFELPMTMVVTTCQDEEGFVAHALDFDLVAVAATEDGALDKVRLAVKTYIEYGITNNWEADIMFPAPKECWERISTDTLIKMMEPITVMDRRLLVFRAVPAHHDLRPISAVA